jgi:serine/threonine protein phosphatase PrpC
VAKLGVLALELLLGTPNVFSVDQRTNALLTNRMRRSGASDDEITHALYLAALSQYCIRPKGGRNWPLRDGDPLHKAEMAKQSCTLQDFHRALRARDPLGIGFDSSTDLLLHMIWQLLAFHPSERMTAKEALDHPYFTSPSGTGDVLFPTLENALESQMLDPRMDFKVEDNVHNFTCPKCGRVFDDWQSCQTHAVARRHAKFCTYEATNLPTCINTHSMLPSHPTSGYCDLQGRRPTIEDFHSIHLYHDHQFYAVMDGHTTNFASKWLASKLYVEIMKRLPLLNSDEMTSLSSTVESSSSNWKYEMTANITAAFSDLHERFLQDVAVMTTHVIEVGSAPRMDQSGTTATALLVTDNLILVASLGDSRAVMSSMAPQKLGYSNKKDGHPSVEAVQLTKDHVASDPAERELVLGKGGSVFSNGPNGLPRVNGTLAITRSIGDADLSPMLSREPHVLILDRHEVREKCGAMGRRTARDISKETTDEFILPCFGTSHCDTSRL